MLCKILGHSQNVFLNYDPMTRVCKRLFSEFVQSQLLSPDFQSYYHIAVEVTRKTFRVFIYEIENRIFNYTVNCLLI